MSGHLSAELLLQGYASGIFPMAESRDTDALYWFDPEWRGVIPLDGFHLSRSMRRLIARAPYQIRVDHAFRATVEACADRSETWINDALFTLYDQLFAAGRAHSVEVWDGEQLVGGTFGIALGGAYFGESMFSRRTNGSKLALAYLVDRLRITGFSLFDTQYLTPHLASLGGMEILRADYRDQLHRALELPADFTAAEIPSPQLLLQRMTQTS